ncbi:MAG TPA: hypothetical protein VF993_04685 [Myxococcales bacterium]
MAQALRHQVKQPCKADTGPLPSLKLRRFAITEMSIFGYRETLLSITAANCRTVSASRADQAPRGLYQ